MELEDYVNLAGYVVAAYSAMVASAAAGNFFINHNKYKVKRNGDEISSKVDGITSSTKLTIGNGSTNIFRFSIFGTTIAYEDSNGDGKVDRIHYVETDGETYRRESDYEECKELFDNADKMYSAQLERFRPFLEKKRKSHKISA